MYACLEEIYAQRTGVTPGGVTTFSQQAPNCEVNAVVADVP